MAANKATVSISASVLPDDMKTHVSSSVTYDLNDGAGDASKWVYFSSNVGSGSEILMPAGISYLGGTASDETAVTHATNDHLEFIVIKHSGYQGDGTTKSTDNIHFNFTDSVDADDATGNLTLEPGDVWYGRFSGTADLTDFTVEAKANTVKLLVYAVLDDV